MTRTLFDRLKIQFYAALANHHRRHPVMTREEHARQRDLVRASELRSTDKSQAHGVYPVRRSSKGWTNGPVIRDTVSTPPKRAT